MTTLPPIRKFLFEHSFENADELDNPPAPVFTQEQLTAAKQDGYNAGYRAGQISTQEEQQAQYNLLLQQIEDNLTTILSTLSKHMEPQQNSVIQIAATFARKLLPNFTEKQGLEEICALIEKTIKDMAQEPRLVIRVNEAHCDAVNKMAQAMAEKQAFPGQIIVLAEESLGASDCRVEWADGGVERNAKKLLGRYR